MSILSSDSIDGKIAGLNHFILDLFDAHAPIKNKIVRRSNFKPHITDTIKEIIKLKKQAYNKFWLSGKDSDKKHYRELSNYLSFAIKEKETHISAVSYI